MFDENEKEELHFFKLLLVNIGILIFLISNVYMWSRDRFGALGDLNFEYNNIVFFSLLIVNLCADFSDIHST